MTMHITMDEGRTHITPSTNKGDFRVSTCSQTRAKRIGENFNIWNPLIRSGIMYFILPGRQAQFMVNQTRKHGGKVEGI
jgi:hypothetical protein